jgi:transaldolase
MFDIKIFYDGVNLEFIKQNHHLIDGVTTNPTLMKKAGIESFEIFSKNLIEISPDKPLSLEVFSDDLIEMKKQALKINSWGDNLYIKIPITNSEGISTKDLIKDLLADGVKLNITAIFTLEQVEEVSDCFVNYPENILSIFCGRIADTGVNPIDKVISISKYLQESNISTNLLWASARQAYNVVEAIESNCQIITLGEDLINKLSNFNKDLTEFSLDTVKMFKNDAETAGYKI